MTTTAAEARASQSLEALETVINYIHSFPEARTDGQLLAAKACRDNARIDLVRGAYIQALGRANRGLWHLGSLLAELSADD